MRPSPRKAWLDYSGAAIGLLVFALPMAVIALAVARNLGRPVLFRQRRPGHLGKPFEILKFRTMRDATGADGRLLPDRERVTRLGRFLRTTSLDELPELVNVLRGEMSLVGPRPLAMQYLPYYSERERKRFDVKPGITGWAQINGRSRISWDEKLELDVWYCEHRTLRLDLRILILTIARVIRRDGVLADDAAAVVDFDAERRSRVG